MKQRTLYNVRDVLDLKDMLNQSASLYGEKEAFLVKNKQDGYDPVSYMKYKNDVDALGTAFINLGLKDKYIAVIGENRYEWCVTYLATVNGTGVIVPIDRELPISEIENLLNRCGATALVFSGKYNDCAKKLAQSQSTLKYFINMDSDQPDGFGLSLEQLIKDGEELIKNGNNEFIEAKIDNDSMSVLLFTSGTTGVAKGVMLSHRNICSDIVSVRSTVWVGDKDRSFSILPIHHTYECTIGFLAFIYSGATISFCEGLKYIAKGIKSIRPTILVVVPLIMENLYKKIWDQAAKQKLGKLKLKLALFICLILGLLGIDVRKKLLKPIHESLGGQLRLVLTGAAAIDPAVSKGFRRMGIKVLQGYGLTECSPLVTGNRDAAFRDKSAGLALPGVEIKIDNPDENGIGEVLTKGPNVMLGYYLDQESTDKSIVDGWFHTGDLGRIDKSGFLYITGRSKNVIIVKNGKNVYPEEIEASINKNPFILESLVSGEYDSTTGETHIHAHILPNMDYIKEKLKVVSVSKEELMKIISDVIKNINRDIPIYRRIRNFSIRDTEFVKTTTKKIKRHCK